MSETLDWTKHIYISADPQTGDIILKVTVAGFTVTRRVADLSKLPDETGKLAAVAEFLYRRYEREAPAPGGGISVWHGHPQC